MFNFDLYLPTRLVFGKGRIDELPELTRSYGSKILLTYGGGSIKRSGIYDKIKELYKGAEIFELSGIEPNPKITSIRKGVEIAKKEKVDFILAVGGGSVLDASKNIAAGAFYDGDPWDLVLDSLKIGRTLPLFSVLTLSATGSEYDNSGVISNESTHEKMPIFGNLWPVASICDPTYTFSVPANQTAAGAADIMSHTFESYIVNQGNTLTDGICEAMLRTVIKNAPIAITEPENYEARAELMMASSFGCCGLLNIGRESSPWVCHGLEHELSAFYDITHGVGLAILTPVWMRYSLNEKTAPRFANYGVNVFGLNPKDDVMTNAGKAIDLTAEFFKKIGLPSKLSEIGIDDTHFEEMADHVRKIWFGDFKDAIRPLEREDLINILKGSL
ncbi:iron-containing alcohol dehydrogenase [Succinivibrio dextrinosolvens]|uniref:iron-containing alcohol dehydrogenase n=1 Tax=Succinivibrio dextrinosolvens TaxID=83771 RepID=UPI0004E18C6E|nr:iron-containing alcohol dehydrogenase [Succinivibrio dextrinosolvens]